LGDALTSKLEDELGRNINTPHRMETMVRTNTFDAINTARFGYFTDPALNGFVEALEYSAVLDDRTTEICQDLDGHVHAVDSNVWERYQPPNHYNCRSLLIPVTKADDWEESGEPSIEPQKGFA
jgi:SPP1 gp7 family putative phage head morphogenesis protein